MHTKAVRILSILLLLAFVRLAAAESLWVGRFSSDSDAIPDPWQVERIDERVPATRYAVRKWDGVNAIEARARKSMALLARAMDVELSRTPYLCWMWRIEAPLATADMTKKEGDDYAARVYLNFEVPADQMSFSTRAKLALARSIFGGRVPDAAINYVWDNRQPVETLQNNAYTDRARMIVLRSGGGVAGRWVSERRNVRDDFRRAFGEFDARLHSMALAADTDNTGEDAHSGFADFRFVTKESECPEPSGHQP